MANEEVDDEKMEKKNTKKKSVRVFATTIDLRSRMSPNDPCARTKNGSVIEPAPEISSVRCPRARISFRTTNELSSG